MSLFDNLPSNAISPASQSSMQFPACLSERYRPHSFADFVGQDKVRKVLTNFVARPTRNAAFLFSGPSGVGKTSAGIALCEALRGELHHVPSQQCNLGVRPKIDSLKTDPTREVIHIGLSGAVGVV